VAVLVGESCAREKVMKRDELGTRRRLVSSFFEEFSETRLTNRIPVVAPSMVNLARWKLP
jgi:hypothetical protein